MKRVKLKQSTTAAKAPAGPVAPKLHEIRIHATGGASLEFDAGQAAQVGAPAETSASQVQHIGVPDDTVARVVVDAPALAAIQKQNLLPTPAPRENELIAWIQGLIAENRQMAYRDALEYAHKTFNMTKREFEKVWNWYPEVHLPDHRPSKRG